LLEVRRGVDREDLLVFGLAWRDARKPSVREHRIQDREALRALRVPRMDGVLLEERIGRD